MVQNRMVNYILMSLDSGLDTKLAFIREGAFIGVNTIFLILFGRAHVMKRHLLLLMTNSLFLFGGLLGKKKRSYVALKWEI